MYIYNFVMHYFSAVPVIVTLRPVILTSLQYYGCFVGGSAFLVVYPLYKKAQTVSEFVPALVGGLLVLLIFLSFTFVRLSCLWHEVGLNARVRRVRPC
jgi:hypothetical protein